MTCHHDDGPFSSYHKIKPIQIKLPNGSQVEAHIRGTILFSPTFILFNVLYVPNFNYNLVSVSQLTDTLNCSLNFLSDRCIVQDTRLKRMIGLAKHMNGLYYVEGSPMVTRLAHCNSNIASNTSSSFSVCSDELWHFRLGHLSSSRLSILNKNFPYISCHVSPLCEICQYAKQKRLPYKLSTHNAKDPFELVHFDIWGPFNVSSIHGHKYFLTVVDDFSRFTWVYLLKLKSEVPNKIQNFVSFVEVHFKKRIKFIRSDNGPEFNLANFYSSKGIIHQTSCRETPQQNGRVERKHQHILNVARALLFQSNLPKIFWSYAILHAVFLINRIPTPILNNSSPFEKLYNKAPDYHDLKPFGCLCYFSTLQHNRHKFDARAKKGVFLGYKLGVKGYLYYDLDSGEISVTRNARFSELTFPYPITQTQSTHISIPSLTTISPTHLGPSPINQPIIPFSYDGPPHLPDPTCSLNGPTSPSPPTSPILDADHHVHAGPPTTRIRR